jgi:hypothetical protein
MALSLKHISQQYIEYAQHNSVNLLDDVIKLPTGDGAAVIFTFDGLHDIHLEYAKSLLSEVNKANQQNLCDKFDSQGWCNCHPNFNLRIGISEGKGIVYRDINGNFNVAGGVINLASRVMGLADRNQIIFTDEAYKQIVDMVDDPLLSDKFVSFSQVRIKHDLEISVFQYIDPEAAYLNSQPPENIVLMSKMKSTMEKLAAINPLLPASPYKNPDISTIISQFDMMSDVFEALKGKQVEAPKKAPKSRRPTKKEEKGRGKRGNT